MYNSTDVRNCQATKTIDPKTHEWLCDSILAQCLEAGARPPEEIPAEVLRQWQTKLQIFRYSQTFGLPVIPLCPPLSDGQGCQVVSGSHGEGCPSPGKRPLVKWASDNYKPTAASLDAYIKMQSNWGLKLGSGLIELDFDSKENYDNFCASHSIPQDAPVIATGRGFKIIVRSKAPISTNFNPPGFEVRVSGQFVLPPSIHKNGKAYRWEKFHGVVPLIDLERDLGIKIPDARPTYQGQDRQPLTTGQQTSIEALLLAHLPNARKIGGEITGCLNSDSRSRSHISVNLAKNCYHDFSPHGRPSGGTISALLKILGIEPEPALGGTSDSDVPHYFSLFALRRIMKDEWPQGASCGELIPVFRRDGVPYYAARAICGSWRCPECGPRLTRVLSARINKLSNLKVFSAPPDAKKVLAKLKRSNRDLLYLRLLTGRGEFVLLRTGDPKKLVETGFKASNLGVQEVVDLVASAQPSRGRPRVINSPAFWKVPGVDVGTANPLSPEDVKETKKGGGGGGKKDDDSVEGINDANIADVDVVVLKGDFKVLLGKIRALGGDMEDVGAGDAYELFGLGRVAAAEMGLDVIAIIDLPSGESVIEPARASPNRPCFTCGTTLWWQLPDGEFVCGRCHPQPNN